ncbi:MarR family winged helix-turn-helix transcriptional regulator [Mycolicibacterium sp. Dal123E01]|uniref:MarR family winged helix-turn-helix transcriptional regulator n=1 Tax=Mycolicibacterium sp. Dal123E01 TaxID=3457578 RepID=UPI00403ED4C8
MGSSSAARVQSALGRLLQRGTRMHLYDRVVDGVEGVDATLYPVLSGVARIGPVSATELAAVIGLDRTAATRYATRLESAGLMSRRPDAADARATLLELTPHGRKAVARMRGNLTRAINDILDEWQPAQAEQFAAALDDFVSRLESLA